MKKGAISSLFISVAAAELVGALSGLLAGNAGAVYGTLSRPPLSPPGWVFPVVWTVLYALMGVAAYLVYQAPSEQGTKRRALILYAAQLVVNFLWSIVFFRFEQFGLAAVVIGLLDILLILTIAAFARISKPAAGLLLPYLVWVLFATYLNIGVVVLNGWAS